MHRSLRIGLEPIQAVIKSCIEYMHDSLVPYRNCTTMGYLGHTRLGRLECKVRKAWTTAIHNAVAITHLVPELETCKHYWHVQFILLYNSEWPGRGEGGDTRAACPHFLEQRLLLFEGCHCLIKLWPRPCSLRPLDSLRCHLHRLPCLYHPHHHHMSVSVPLSLFRCACLSLCVSAREGGK
jgi:hypothetical protein